MTIKEIIVKVSVVDGCRWILQEKGGNVSYEVGMYGKDIYRLMGKVLKSLGPPPPPFRHIHEKVIKELETLHGELKEKTKVAQQGKTAEDWILQVFDGVYDWKDAGWVMRRIRELDGPRYDKTTIYGILKRLSEEGKLLRDEKKDRGPFNKRVSYRVRHGG